jgi:hypothetical protein
MYIILQNLNLWQQTPHATRHAGTEWTSNISIIDTQEEICDKESCSKFFNLFLHLSAISPFHTNHQRYTKVTKMRSKTSFCLPTIVSFITSIYLCCGVFPPCGNCWSHRNLEERDCATVVERCCVLPPLPSPRFALHCALLGYTVNTGSRNSKEGSRDFRDIMCNNTQCCVLPHVRLQRL